MRKWVNQKTVVCLHNGIPCSRRKGAPALWDSMEGTGEHYAKWNKPGGERQITYEFAYKWNLIKTSKQNRSKDLEIRPKLTVTRSKVRGEAYNRGNKEKGLLKEHIQSTHGCGQQGGDGLWEWGVSSAGESNGGNWDNCNWTTIKK